MIYVALKSPVYGAFDCEPAKDEIDNTVSHNGLPSTVESVGPLLREEVH